MERESLPSKGYVRPDPALGRLIIVVGRCVETNSLVTQALGPCLEWSLEILHDHTAALGRIRAASPHVVLVSGFSAKPAELDFIARTRMITRRLPLIVLASTPHSRNILAALTAGASGCLVMPVPPQLLRQAITQAINHHSAFCSRAQDAILEHFQNLADRVSLASLTPREVQILATLSSARSVKDIAGDLHISATTFRAHLSHIYKKLESHGRAEALARLSHPG